MSANERRVDVDGVLYTARVVGPAPWNRRKQGWKFWQVGSPVDDSIAGEIVEFEGHPEPLRHRPRTAIPIGTLNSMSQEDLVRRVRRALYSAQRPVGADMVALVRADQRMVIDWGTWNSLCALLLACGYDTEWVLGEEEVSEHDAIALSQLLSGLQRKGGKSADEWLASSLRTELIEFVAGGSFRIVDIG